MKNKDKKSNITLVILAAGASSRMGEPKQLLPWNDSFLLKHAIQTAEKSSAKDIVVVLGANFERIKEKIKASKITVLNNHDWELGLGKSIAHAVSFVKDASEKNDGVLFMLADQPFITEMYLDKLISSFSSNSKQIIATAYKDGSKGVPTLFDTVYFDELLLLKDDNGAQSVVRKNKQHVKVLESGIDNFDIDSQEDYDRFFI